MGCGASKTPSLDLDGAPEPAARVSLTLATPEAAAALKGAPIASGLDAACPQATVTGSVDDSNDGMTSQDDQMLIAVSLPSTMAIAPAAAPPSGGRPAVSKQLIGGDAAMQSGRRSRVPSRPQTAEVPVSPVVHTRSAEGSALWQTPPPTAPGRPSGRPSDLGSRHRDGAHVAVTSLLSASPLRPLSTSNSSGHVGVSIASPSPLKMHSQHSHSRVSLSRSSSTEVGIGLGSGGGAGGSHTVNILRLDATSEGVESIEEFEGQRKRGGSIDELEEPRDDSWEDTEPESFLTGLLPGGIYSRHSRDRDVNGTGVGLSRQSSLPPSRPTTCGDGTRLGSRQGSLPPSRDGLRSRDGLPVSAVPPGTARLASLRNPDREPAVSPIECAVTLEAATATSLTLRFTATTPAHAAVGPSHAAPPTPLLNPIPGSPNTALAPTATHTNPGHSRLSSSTSGGPPLLAAVTSRASSSGGVGASTGVGAGSLNPESVIYRLEMRRATSSGSAGGCGSTMSSTATSRLLTMRSSTSLPPPTPNSSSHFVEVYQGRGPTFELPGLLPAHVYRLRLSAMVAEAGSCGFGHGQGAAGGARSDGRGGPPRTPPPARHGPGRMPSYDLVTPDWSDWVEAAFSTDPAPPLQPNPIELAEDGAGSHTLRLLCSGLDGCGAAISCVRLELHTGEEGMEETFYQSFPGVERGATTAVLAARGLAPLTAYRLRARGQPDRRRPVVSGCHAADAFGACGANEHAPCVVAIGVCCAPSVATARGRRKQQ